MCFISEKWKEASRIFYTKGKKSQRKKIYWTSTYRNFKNEILFKIISSATYYFSIAKKVLWIVVYSNTFCSAFSVCWMSLCITLFNEFNIYCILNHIKEYSFVYSVIYHSITAVQFTTWTFIIISTKSFQLKVSFPWKNWSIDVVYNFVKSLLTWINWILYVEKSVSKKNLIVTNF